jgi:hypothetical protein
VGEGVGSQFAADASSLSDASNDIRRGYTLPELVVEAEALQSPTLDPIDLVAGFAAGSVIGGVIRVLRGAGAAVAARAITTETSMLARASEAAFRAAGRADDFALGAKHAAGAGGRWAKFAEGVNPNAALREALSAPGARVLPNDANSFRVVTDLGRIVGSRGETGIRAVVDFEGRVVTWFPVRP